MVWAATRTAKAKAQPTTTIMGLKSNLSTLTVLSSPTITLLFPRQLP
jgi:hypothetical protein